MPLLVAQEAVLDLGGPEVLLVGAGHHEAALGGEEGLEALTLASVETVQLPPESNAMDVIIRCGNKHISRK